MANILIVGGSKGIGFQLAQNLSSNNNITSVSRTKSEDFNQAVNQVESDVISDVFEYEGEVLDSLVYCPGSINLRPFNRLSEKDFLNDFNLNVLGAVKSIQANLPKLKKSSNGSIVLFSTVAVSQGMPFHSSVAASKGAIEGLVRSLAAELAPTVRVNAVAPSVTNTPLASKLLSSEEKIEKSGERHPMKRVGQPQDIASVVEFLISNKSSWVTGQVIGVDGGMSTVRSF
ncbi:SDR family NAD(P)-dependent oxidoreductase [Fulvivirga lutimaris]|uniref:SDR family NAD(P)-dependent oxidoreductase n=1 Tax=Fulvivirga lutimaris TaxID=1819566 RepID=UPI0012BD1BEA|nr:SDR family oxidoreductase [Fulvivirga lutimaris]MTI39452.1 SDR family oxidoreductase [Fulvivirga lutimaris]